MKLIVGLGNVGKRYQHTRHNLGFMVINALAHQLQAEALREYEVSGVGKTAPPAARPEWKLTPKLQAEIARIDLAPEGVLLAKPQTMMNGSGDAISKIMQFYKIAPSDVWVIFDDVDVPFGRLRIRAASQSGSGHQGVNSTIARIGQNFIRIKVGISLNDRATQPSEVYVLNPFNDQEHADLPKLIEGAARVIGEQLQAPHLETATFELLSST